MESFESFGASQRFCFKITKKLRPLSTLGLWELQNTGRPQFLAFSGRRSSLASQKRQKGSSMGGGFHIYIYIHTCIHTYIHTYMHTCIHAHTCICTYTYTSTYIRTHIKLLANSQGPNSPWPRAIGTGADRRNKKTTSLVTHV